MKRSDAVRQQDRERQRKSRAERKLLNRGYQRVELFLPPVVKAAWIARERIADAKAPLPIESYPDDLVAVLCEWAQRWLRAASRRGGTR